MPRWASPEARGTSRSRTVLLLTECTSRNPSACSSSSATYCGATQRPRPWTSLSVVVSGGGSRHGSQDPLLLRAGSRTGIDSPSRLSDYLVRLEEHARRDGEAERFGGLQVDHQIELHGLLHGQIGGLGAFEDLVHIGGRTP